MSTNIVNSVAYLKTTREFPEDLRQLTIECNKGYVDTANAINVRTIGIFSINRPAITGESWYVQTSRKQQTIRQVYTFTSAGSIPHGIVVSKIAGFTKIYGTFTDGTDWYPLPYVDVVAANNQVNVIVTPTNIVITGGGGGGQPAITSGFCILEWLSEP